MPAYNINKSNGTPVTIAEATVDTQFDIPLIGQNATNYGDDVATAFLRLLENFASATAPTFGSGRTAGQLWFNTTTTTLNVWDGTQWISSSGAIDNAYVAMTDGTSTASASGADTFKFRSANNILTAVVTNNDVTHGDNVLLTVNQANINHNALTSVVANEHVNHASVSVLGGQSLAGGGDLTASRTLTLVNDSAAPGASRYYGTNPGGTKGFYELPVGGGGGNTFLNLAVTDTDSGFSWSATGTVVADSVTDTATFVSGVGIDIDADPANDGIRISHLDTSSAVNLSSSNSNGVVLQGISLTYDTFGHVTASTVATTNLDTRYTRASANETVTGIWAFTSPTAPTIRDGSTSTDYTAGFRDIPQNSQTAAYVLAIADRGKHISITTGGVSIPTNGSVAFPVGTTVVVYNNSASNQSIQAVTPGTTVLRWAGTTSTGTRTLANYGVATVMKVATDTWIISGVGLT